MNLSNEHSKLNLSLELSSQNLFIELNNKSLSNELSNQNMSNKSSLQYDLYHNNAFCIRVKKKINLMSSIPSFHCFKYCTLWNAVISVGNLFLYHYRTQMIYPTYTVVTPPCPSDWLSTTLVLGGEASQKS